MQNKQGEMYIGTAIGMMISVIVSAIVYLACVQFILPMYFSKEAEQSQIGYSAFAQDTETAIDEHHIHDTVGEEE